MFEIITEALKTWPWFDIFTKAIRIFLLLAVGIPLFSFLERQANRLLKERMSAQARMIASKSIFYAGMALIAFMLLYELGFKLTTVLGAAGVIGVAVGFASQKSLSNIISGLFLISERSFAVGDMIKIGDTLGFVMSVNLLSVRLRTRDNQMIRIPNENIVQNEVINISSFPIRRMDIAVSVAYKENLKHVVKVLKEIADKNNYCLDEPEPFVLIQKFGDSGIDILFGPWFARDDYVKFKNSIMHDIKTRFDKEGIEIPFPHISLYAGSATSPIPIQEIKMEAAAAESGSLRDEVEKEMKERA